MSCWLKPAVEEAVEAAEALLGNQREFDPTSSNRLFTVSMSEYAMTGLAEPLARVLGGQAPGCALAMDGVGVPPDQFESQLMRRDLIIGPLGFEFPGRRQPVFTDHLVCVVARDNVRLTDGALSLDDLRDMPHAVAQFGAAGGRKRPLEVEPERWASRAAPCWCRSPPCSPCPSRSAARRCARSSPPAWRGRSHQLSCAS